MGYRRAQKVELNQLAQMRWAYWVEGGSDPAKQDKATFVSHFVEDLATKLNTDWYVWCAFEEDVILSHVYIQRVQKIPKPSAPSEALGYVTTVYTRPSYRSRGIGSKLMQHVKAWARKADLEFLVLWPSKASIPFWHRAEFDVDDPLVFGVRPYEN